MPPEPNAAAAPPATPPAGAGAALNTPPAPPTPPAGAAPGNTPPAANGAAGGAPTPPSPPDWTAGLADDAKGYIQNKGFKTPADVLESYRQLEKTFGVPQDRLLKLPEDMNTPEGRAIRERLGAPKEAKDYGLDKLVPKEGGDPKLAEWASTVFHEIGVPVRDAENILKKWNERAELNQKASKDNYEAMITNGEAALKKDWGAAYERNINMAKSGARVLELKGEELDALERVMGRERLFKKLQVIGQGTGEAGFVTGRPSGDSIVSPEQARQRLTEMRMDPVFTKRFLAGEMQAKQEMERMQKMAYPGDFTI